MTAIIKKIILTSLLLGFSIKASAVVEKVFVCKNFEFVTEDLENPVWVPLEDFTSIKLTPNDPLWTGVLFKEDGQVLQSGDVPSVNYYADLTTLDSDKREMATYFLGVSEEDIGSYQVYTLGEDGGDGTGFYILEFFKPKLQEEELKTIGSVFIMGWGFGRCQNQ